MATGLHRLPLEKPIYELEDRIAALEAAPLGERQQEELRRLKRELVEVQRQVFGSLDPWQTVEVACPSPRPWSILVRTNAAGGAPRAVAVEAPAAGNAPLPVVETPAGQAMIVVLATSLRSGTVIAPEHLALAPALQDVSTGLFTDPGALVGRRLLRALGAGHALRARHLDHDWAVERGRPVLIVAEVGGLAVAMPGKALADGQIGDFVKVENTSSGRVIEGIVEGPEKIRPIANIP